MRRSRTTTGLKVTRRIAPIALVAMLGVGAAACGSSGSKTNVQNSPTTTAPTGTSPSTTAPQSGGAGF